MSADPRATALFLGAFFDELARWGVHDVVVSPGSRSTPLTMTAFELSRREPERLRVFVDVDERVRELFAEAGEEAFRAIETDVVRELAEKEPLLVSCGGGAVLRPFYRDGVPGEGYTVYLQVTADEAASRISDVSTRPLFRDLDTARATIEARLPLYEDVADAVVDTSGKSVAAIAREVRGVLEREGILWQRK